MKSMIKKLCLTCGVEAWHNPCNKSDRDYRCTYCGTPPSGDSSSAKRALCVEIINKQVAKARSRRLQ